MNNDNANTSKPESSEIDKRENSPSGDAVPSGRSDDHWADGTTYEDEVVDGESPAAADGESLDESTPFTAFLQKAREARIRREFLQEQIEHHEAILADLREEAAKFDAICNGVDPKFREFIK